MDWVKVRWEVDVEAGSDEEAWLLSLHIYGQVRPKARQAAVDVMGLMVAPPRPLLLPKISRGERY